MTIAWLDRAPLPTGVIRGGSMAYANDALCRMLGLAKEQIVGRLFFEFVADEDRERVRDRYARRERGERVPDSYELALLCADGSRRAVEIWISAEPQGDLVFQLNDHTDGSYRHDRLVRLAHLGVAVQTEQSEEAIFAAIARGVTELDMALVRFAPELPDASTPYMRVLGISAPGDRLQQFAASIQLPVEGLIGEWGEFARQAWREGSSYVDDMPLATAAFFGAGGLEGIASAARAGVFSRGIVIRIDVHGRPVELIVLTADWLRQVDLPACRLFGAQVSAALDAARVIRDVQSRNAALAALNRIAAAGAAANDLHALFARGAYELKAVVGCDAISVYLIDEARDEAVLAYARGGSEAVRRELRRVPLAGTKLGLVARDGVTRVVHRDDYAPVRRALLDEAGHRVIVSVALIIRGKVLGAMEIAFRDERAVLPREIDLMQAAGAHFAAAVDADRLVADLRRSYAELARAQEQLVERERLAAIGELAAVVAHEVRNPLGVLFNSLGALRKLLGVEVQGSTETLLGIMEEEAARLNHIVRDLLDFARPTTPTLQRERLDAVVEEAVDAAVGETGGGVRVVREVGEVPPLRMDARLMRQALLNLADNAVQAMPKGGTLTVRLAVEDHGGGRAARIELADTGLGIAPEVEPRIFEPFFTTRASGTGLGLAVVKRIVDGHRGQLQVSSVEGRGTTFTIWLPLDEEATRASGEWGERAG